MNRSLAPRVCAFLCVSLAYGCSSSSTTSNGGDGTSDTADSGSIGTGGLGGSTGAGGVTGSGGRAGVGGSVATGGSTGAAGSPSRGCDKVFYSGEPGEKTLLDCGTWSDPKTMPDGTSTFKEITDNPHSGTTALQISLAQVAGAYGTDWGLAFGYWNPDNAIDASQSTELSVWMRADHQTGGFNLWLTDSNKGVSTYKTGLTLGTEWTNIRIPMTELAKTGFDPTHADTLASDMHDDGHGGVVWYLDDGVFVTPCP